MASQIQKKLPESPVVQDVAADHAVAQSPVNNPVCGAVDSCGSVVPPGLHGVAYASDTAGPVQKNLCGILAVEADQFAGALEEVSGDGELRAGRLALAQGKSAGTGAIEEIARDLVAIAAADQHILFVVPLDAVTAEGDGCIFVARREPGAAVAGEPIVEEESVPAAQAQAVALVKGKHRVTYAETPCPPKPCTIAGEAIHLTVFNAKSIFVMSIFGSVYEEAMNVFA